MRKMTFWVFIAFCILSAQNHPHSFVLEKIDHLAPSGLPFTFAVYGDSWSPNSVYRNLVRNIDQMDERPLFAIHVGDWAAGGALSDYLAHLAVADSLITPTLHVLGNHEINLYEGLANYDSLIGSADTSFDVSGARFILMQNTHYTDTLDFFGENTLHMFKTAQLEWLDSVLTGFTGPKFLFYHAPASVSGHLVGGAMGGVGYRPSLAESNTEQFTTLLRDHNVTAAFCGHLHNYDRYCPLNERYGNVLYIVTGGAGQRLNVWPYSAPFGGSFYHFLLITVNEDGSINGRLFYPDDSLAVEDPVYAFKHPELSVKESDSSRALSKVSLTSHTEGDRIIIRYEKTENHPLDLYLYDVSGRLLDWAYSSYGFKQGEFVFTAGFNG
jgi:hypothetical protein